jgi:hypothetical protein
VEVVEAVRTLAEYGMIVNGGFILGFDNETDKTANHMVDLIQDTGICMAMVGTLSALPNTQLSRRLEREGRLFSGALVIGKSSDIDQTTSGLNFVTTRPREAILQDHADVFRHIYSPKNYYRRVLYTAINLHPNSQNKASLGQAFKLFWGFIKLSSKAGINPRTAYYYWRTLFQVLIRNPRSVEAVANLAAMYVHFGKQSDYVVQLIDEKLKELREMGEEAYNQFMIGGRLADESISRQ